MSNDQFSFKPKARIMELLGEQLIRSHVLALFELVKNSYDADAKEVQVRMLDVNNAANGLIEIEDDGSGMSFETVTTIWMEPGNGHKGDKRKELIKVDRSERGRLPIGEKGVGRFAVHRLGKDITVVTRAANQLEVVIEIDWEAFLTNDFLEDATIKIIEREPKVFCNDTTGTRITIGNLKHKWTRGEVRKLYKQVIGMTTASVTEQAIADFKVYFDVDPNAKWLEDLIDPNDIKAHSLFRFDFTLDNDGLVYDYHFTPFPAMQADYGELLPDRTITSQRSYSEFFSLQPPTAENSWAKRIKRPTKPKLSGDDGLNIGKITGTILGFDLDSSIKKRYLQDEAGGITEFMKEQGGIRVYRDGLRVYDYGEPGNDWLGLDHRRIQRPTAKLSNQIILGEIHLDLSESTGLSEKTSREGFIENEAYNEFKYAVLCALTDFEAERNKDKKKLRAVLEIKPENKHNGLPKRQSLESLLDDLKTLVVEKKLGDDVGSIVKKVGSSYKEAREALLSSSGAGLGLVTVFHELERGVRSLHHLIDLDCDHKTLKAQSNELVSMFQGVMYLVNKKSMEKMSASSLVNLAISTQKLRFKRHSVKFLNGFENLKEQDFEIKGLRRMLIASLVNMIDNAIYWTDQLDTESVLWIGPSHDLEAPAIIIADNGPGFMDKPDEVIEPFFSRKSEGMGIGLYYSDWVMRSHHGRLAFPEKHAVEIPEVLDGAILALVFGEGS